MTVRCPTNALTLEVAGKARNRYVATIPKEHSKEDVLDPDYFGQVMASDRLTVRDLIEVEWEDLTRFGELQVRAQVKSTSQLITRVRSWTEYETPNIPAKWAIEWIGGAEHHGIYYDGDLKEAGFLSQDNAAARIHALVARDREASAARAAIKTTTATPAKSKKIAAKEPA